ncbi:hypothetical protein AA0113_g8825 [Alternaria arborescens]|uniref:Heterokaryon incompatibility domain-containing protein n=1 Tax=Alternaria arborescens TaxID=156630 RepID=A0A4Q4RFR5_9PLEO|nr:hypothetical protein AA0113_g8825 [Alternaria arborescens]
MALNKENRFAADSFPFLSTCLNCEGIPAGSPRPLDSLQQGLDQGCGLCTVILQGISTFEAGLSRGELEQFAKIKYVTCWTLKYGPCRIGLTTSPTGHERQGSGSEDDDFEAYSSTFELLVSLVEDRPDLSRGLRTADSLRVPAQLQLSKAVLLASKWIAECDDSHQCRNADQSALPTRVLDLCPKVDGHIELVESRGASAQYAALSYCWGYSGTNFKTLTTNLAQHHQGIPFSQFPKCFQDTIQLCQALGLRYLWIDALCIIQDSPGDWEVELARMAAVYSNAFLTISAAACSDPSMSLFADRQVYTVRETAEFSPHSYRTIPYVVYVEYKEKETDMYSDIDPSVDTPKPHLFEFRHDTGTAHWRIMEPGISGLNESRFAQCPDSPLFTRGWVYQERLLSARILHFHAEEVLWECRTGVRCECGSLDDDDAAATDRTRDIWRLRNKASLTRALSPGANPQLLFQTWADIVMRFSQLDLSYDTDRLPALSGIASRFAEHPVGQYFAGMWSEMFPTSLMYDAAPPPGRRDYQFDTSCRSRAPSWSWASLPLSGRNHVNYSFALPQFFEKPCPDFTLIFVAKHFVGKNQYGWVQNAELRVCARCVDCFVVKHKLFMSGCSYTADLCLNRKPPNTLQRDRIVSDSRFLQLDEWQTAVHNEEALFLHLGSEHGIGLRFVYRKDDGQMVYRRIGLALNEANGGTWAPHSTIREITII